MVNKVKTCVFISGKGTNLNSISYIDIASSGYDVDFGDITQARYASGAFSSATRGILGGGRPPSRVATIDYVTIAITGNAIEFGDSTWTGAYKSGASSPDRGVWMGGRTPGDYKNLIDYHQIFLTK